MIRKIFLIKGIAIYFMIIGTWYICISVQPVFKDQQLDLNADLIHAIVGILMLRSATPLFRLKESGRQGMVILMIIYLTGSGLIGLFIFIMVWQSGAEFNLYNLDSIIGPGLYVLRFLAIPLLFALLVVIFLSHKETKELFSAKVPAQVETTDTVVTVRND